MITSILMVYGISVVTLLGVTVILWGISYTDAEYKFARKCLVFIPKTLIWPHYAAKMVVHAIQNTLEKGSN